MAGQQFRLTLGLHKEPGNNPVYCKMDGQRFVQPKTVKLLADGKYRIDLNVRPSKTVKGISVMERTLEVTENPTTDEDDKSSSNYTAHFILDSLNPSKKGQRESVPISIQLDRGCTFSTHLQVKVYKTSNTQHCDWGTTVHSIEYECAVEPSSSTAKIIKETFR